MPRLVIANRDDRAQEYDREDENRAAAGTHENNDAIAALRSLVEFNGSA
jgi:hypothetical protein